MKFMRLIFLFIVCLFVVQITQTVRAADPVVLPAEKSEYVLPYPGILPDHPLYFLKNIRDRIMEMLIADPLRKIEFYILQSDKSISAAMFLTSQNKLSLALQMISISRDDKRRAADMVKSIQVQGKEVPAYILERLSKSFSKQLEIVSDFEQKMSSDKKNDVAGIRESIQKLEGEITAQKK